MTAPDRPTREQPDRPTREQVEADLAEADVLQGPAWEARARFAAEVRALRAELNAGGDDATWKAGFDKGWPAHELTVAALVARTPQPADPADTAEAGDHLGKAWVDAQQTLHAGGCRAVAPGGVWMCTRSGHPNGRVVVVWGAAPQPAEPCTHDSKWNHTRDGRCAVPGCAPLPAVPDGEHARRAEWRAAGRPVHLVNAAAPAMRTLLRRISSRQVGADDAVDALLSWPNLDDAGGEDVPARLDAAADVLAPFDSSKDSSARQAERHLRRAADWLNATSPAARAAVAAALARPTGGGDA